jgi:hypothetical protein
MMRRCPANVLKGMGARYIDAGSSFNIRRVFDQLSDQHRQDYLHRRSAM